MAVTNDNDDKSALVKWFVDDTHRQFDDYNAIMAGIATEKVVGEDAETNFFTARWISTMIAVEATAVIAFLTIQSAFMLVTRTVLQALRFSFTQAGETLKEQGKVTLVAFKILLSMVPLIILGVLAPEKAYAKVAQQLSDNIEANKAAAKAAETVLKETKEKLATALGEKKEVVAKLKPEELAARVTALKDAHVANLKAIATAAGIAEDSGFATIRDRVAHLEAEVRRLAAGADGAAKLQGVDHAICTALKMGAQEFDDATRLEHIKTLGEGHAKVAGLEHDLAKANRVKAEAEARVAELERELETATEAKEALTAEQAELKEKAEQLAALQKTHAEKLEELRVATEALATLREQKATADDSVVRLARELEEEKAKVLARDATIKTLKGTATGDTALADQLQTQKELVARKERELAELTTARERELREKEEAHGLAVKTLQDEVAALKQDLEAQEREHTAAVRDHEERLTEAAQRNEELGKELEAERLKVTTHEDQAARIQTLIETHERTLEAEKALTKAATERAEDLDAQLTKVKGLEGRIATLTDEHRRALEAEVEKTKASDEARAELQTRFDALNKEKLELGRRLGELGDAPAQLATLIEEKAQAETRLDEVVKELATTQEQLRFTEEYVTKVYLYLQQANASVVELTRFAKGYTEGWYADAQTMPHALLFSRAPTHDLLHNVEVEDVMDPATKTKLTYQLLSDRDGLGAYVDKARETTHPLSCEGAVVPIPPGVLDLYKKEDFARNIAVGRLAPIPTFIPYLNFHRDGTDWEPGETTIVVLGLKLVQENGSERIVAFQTRGDNPAIFMPIGATDERRAKSVSQVLPGGPVITPGTYGGITFDLEDGEDAIERVKCDLSTYTTDVSWLGQAAKSVAITEEQLAAIRVAAERMDYDIVMMDKASFDAGDGTRMAGIVNGGYDTRAARAMVSSLRIVAAD